MNMSLTLCILLWAAPGAEDGLIAYEDRVLRIVPEHGGRILQRARGSGTDGQPLEIQLLEFPSAQALDAFMTDDRRQALAAERDQVISKTEVIEVQLVHAAPGL
jgi:uncharacterized protein (DUF1330 family)